MYGWIWRHLPGGVFGKLAGSLLLVAAAVLALWLVVFPAVEDSLPFNDVTVEGEETPGPSGLPDSDPSGARRMS